MKKAIFLLMLAVVSLAACSRKDKESARTTAQDNAIAEGAFDDVYKQVDFACKDQASPLKLSTWSCATITVSPSDTITFPKTITIDFGTAGCTSNDGVVRKGKIQINMTGKYRTPGTVITITLDNYYKDGTKIEGVKTITNKGKNAENHTYFEIEVEDAKITTDDGREISWNSSRKREWIEGEETPWPTYTDDVYEIKGTATGVNSEGNNFTIAITTPLNVAMNCHWIRSGILELTPEGVPTRTLDFGDGTCNNEAILTIKNKTYNITLK